MREDWSWKPPKEEVEARAATEKRLALKRQKKRKKQKKKPKIWPKVQGLKTDELLDLQHLAKTRHLD